MDFTDDGILIYKRYYFNYSSAVAFLITPQINNLAQTYEIQSFTMFDVNDLGSIAFVGENILSTSEQPIFYITVIDKNKGTLFHRQISP